MRKSCTRAPPPTPQALLSKRSVTFSSRAKTLSPLYVGPEPGPLGHQVKNMHLGASPSGLAIALDDSPFETQVPYATLMGLLGPGTLKNLASL